MLDNRCVFPRADLAIGGVNDPECERVHDLKPDPAGVFKVATNGEFRILLQHRPAPDYARIHGDGYEYGADLQLSGHTHGGVMPGLDYLVSRANKGLVKGLYRKDDGSAVYVSPGAGQWAGFPVRLFNDSEITVITLRRKR
jgi:predicted MPP superfamily phosphohydrolase